MKKFFVWALPALALALSAPLFAGDEDERGDSVEERQEQRLEAQRAREELQRAREELRRAAEELARVTRELDHDSPRAKAYEYMSNPKRAMLGVTISDGPEKNGEVRGVLLTGITPGGGAAKAGLKSGDILLSANGQALAAKEDEKPSPEKKLRDIMGKLKPGDEVKLDYEREGKRASTKVIAARQDEMLGSLLRWNDEGEFDVLVPPVPPIPPMGPFAMRVRNGDPEFMQLAKLDADLAPYFKTDKGVLVLQAPREGTLGLKGGDVIVALDGDKVTSPVAVWETLGDLDKDEKVKAEIVRAGKTLKLEGTVPSHRRIIRKHIEIETGEP